MPFTPNVALGGQPMPPSNPFETFSNMMRAKQSIDAQKIQKRNDRISEIQLEDIEKEREDEKYFQGLVQQHVGEDGAPNWQGVSRAALAAGKFDIATKAQAQQDSVLRAKDVREAADLKRLKDSIGLVSGAYRAASRAATPEAKQQQWDFANNLLVDMFGQEQPGPDGKPTKVAPTWAKDLIPPVYSDQAAETVGMLGLGADEELKFLEIGIKTRAEALDLMTKGSDASKKQRLSLGAWLATAHSPQQVADYVKAARETYRVPDAIISAALDGKQPEEMTPDDLKALNARGRQLAMSAKDFAGTLDAAAENALAIRNANLAQKRLDFDMQRATADDPTLPIGVKQYLASLPLKKTENGTAYSLDDALGEFRRHSEEQLRSHPRLDVSKATKMINSLYGKTDSLFDGWLGGGTDVSGDSGTDVSGAAPVVPPNGPAAAAGAAPPPAGARSPWAPPAAATAPQAAPRRAAAIKGEQRIVGGVLSSWNGARWDPVKK